MQEFTWPGRTAETELAFNLEKAALRREFEQHLEECGTLAYRVARGVLRNAADAEDVAQEAMLRSYRRFARPRDRLDCSWSEWLRQLSYKAAEAGRNFVAVDPKYTSQTCSECGFLHENNRKTQAEFELRKCFPFIRALTFPIFERFRYSPSSENPDCG